MSYLVPGNDAPDPVAVRIAATGSRVVQLTRDESLLACALIIAAGCQQSEVARRLGKTEAYVSKLCRTIRRNFGAEPLPF